MSDSVAYSIIIAAVSFTVHVFASPPTFSHQLWRLSQVCSLLTPMSLFGRFYRYIVTRVVSLPRFPSYSTMFHRFCTTIDPCVVYFYFDCRFLNTVGNTINVVCVSSLPPLPPSCVYFTSLSSLFPSLHCRVYHCSHAVILPSRLLVAYHVQPRVVSHCVCLTLSDVTHCHVSVVIATVLATINVLACLPRP